MKKFLTILLSLGLLTGVLAGCASNAAPEESKPDESKPENDPV